MNIIAKITTIQNSDLVTVRKNGEEIYNIRLGDTQNIEESNRVMPANLLSYILENISQASKDRLVEEWKLIKTTDEKLNKYYILKTLCTGKGSVIVIFDKHGLTVRSWGKASIKVFDITMGDVIKDLYELTNYFKGED